MPRSSWSARLGSMACWLHLASSAQKTGARSAMSTRSMRTTPLYPDNPVTTFVQPRKPLAAGSRIAESAGSRWELCPTDCIEPITLITPTSCQEGTPDASDSPAKAAYGQLWHGSPSGLKSVSVGHVILCTCVVVPGHPGSRRFTSTTTFASARAAVAAGTSAGSISTGGSAERCFEVLPRVRAYSQGWGEAPS